MGKMICIPVEQYALMLEAYDNAIKRIQEMREILESIESRAEPDREAGASWRKSKK